MKRLPQQPIERVVRSKPRVGFRERLAVTSVRPAQGLLTSGRMWISSKTISQGAMLSIVAASTAMWACSRQPKVEDASVARLSNAGRQKVFDAERRVDVAVANLNAAEAGIREAKQFRDIASDELSAAKSQAEAAANAVELGRQTRDSAMATMAEQTHGSADTKLRAAQAKEAFADSLVELREKKRDAAKAHVSLATAQRELAKFDAAQAAGTAKNLSRNDFVNAEMKARQEVETAEAQAKQTEERTNQLRHAWREAKRNVKGPAYPDVAPPKEPPEMRP